jgi:Ca2+-binding RTX toxin-like protein
MKRTVWALTTVGLVLFPVVRAASARAADSCSLDPTTHVLTASVSSASGISVTSTTLWVGDCGPMDATQIDAAEVTATDGNDTFAVSVTLPWPSGPTKPLLVDVDLGGGTDTMKWDSRSSVNPVSIHATSAGFDFDDDGGADLSPSGTEAFELRSGVGDDTFDASGGIPPGMTDVMIEDGPGHDTIVGGPEDDWINPWDGDDDFSGGTGNDTVEVMSLASNTSFDLGSWDGGDGEDALVFEEPVVAALNFGWARETSGAPPKMSYTSFEDATAMGSGSNLIGDDAANVLEIAQSGILRGGGGGDTLISDGPSGWADYGDATGVDVDLAAGTATGDGNDTLIGVRNLVGSPGNDTITGIDDQASQLLGEAGNDTIVGGPYEDLLIGGGGNDDLRGGDGPDDLHGGPGKDLMAGGAGGDDFSGGSGRDDIRGGPGTDGWNASFFSITEQDEPPTEGASVDLRTGVVGDDGFGTTDAISGIEDASGTFFADRLIGDDGDNILFGSSGNDRIVGGAGADDLDGGTGRDTVSYAAASHAVDVDLTAHTATGLGHDTLGGIEVVIGGPDGDLLRGSSADQRLEGHGGNDVLLGRGGGDALVGGPGADAMDGGEGHDTCNGGDGHEDTAKECETVWRVP